jgi:hypothetical protein
MTGPGAGLLAQSADITLITPINRLVRDLRNHTSRLISLLPQPPRCRVDPQSRGAARSRNNAATR